VRRIVTLDDSEIRFCHHHLNFSYQTITVTSEIIQAVTRIVGTSDVGGASAYLQFTGQIECQTTISSFIGSRRIVVALDRTPDPSIVAPTVSQIVQARHRWQTVWSGESDDRPYK
jgi:hypothetical protein